MTERDARGRLRVVRCGMLTLPDGTVAFTHSRGVIGKNKERVSVCVGTWRPVSRTWTATDRTELPCPDLATAVRLVWDAVFASAGEPPPKNHLHISGRFGREKRTAAHRGLHPDRQVGGWRVIRSRRDGRADNLD